MAEIFQDYEILRDFLDLAEITPVAEGIGNLNYGLFYYKRIFEDEKYEFEYKTKQELAAQILKNYYSTQQIGKFLENCWIGDEKNEHIIKPVHKYLKRLSFNKLMNIIKGKDIDSKYTEFDKRVNMNIITWSGNKCYNIFVSLVENLKNELGKLIESETHELLNEHESMRTKDVNKIVSSYIIEI